MGGDERESRKGVLGDDLPINRPGVAAITLAPDTRSLSGLDDDRRAAPAVGRRGSLLVIAGLAADIGSHVAVSDEVRIGRGGEGLILRDGRISRFHARVFQENGRWFLEDLGSTNGTALNGRMLDRPTPLGDGDKIHAGSTVLRFAVVDEAEAAFFERMDRLASTDPLTGLPAKHRFDSMLEEELRAARLGGTRLSVLMMDLDGLKAVNDEHGHAMGANTVAVVGAAVGQLLVGHGEACRFGGDEFCAYLPGFDEWAALGIAEALCERVRSTPSTLGEVTVHATISIGVASRTFETVATELVAAADRALYRAKAKGRNCAST